MNISWQILIGIIANIVAVYAIVDRKNYFFRTNIDLQFFNLNSKFNEVTLQINTILQGDIRELRGRIQKVETGQDEWTKTLRNRTHELSNELNRMQLEFAVLKGNIRVERSENS